MAGIDGDVDMDEPLRARLSAAGCTSQLPHLLEGSLRAHRARWWQQPPDIGWHRAERKCLHPSNWAQCRRQDCHPAQHVDPRASAIERAVRKICGETGSMARRSSLSSFYHDDMVSFTGFGFTNIWRAGAGCFEFKRYVCKRWQQISSKFPAQCTT